MVSYFEQGVQKAPHSLIGNKNRACGLPETTAGLTDAELHWYRDVYKGNHVPQLTFRSILMGMFLGGFMSLSNLYVGLKTGWCLGVAITSCILSFTIYKTLMAIFPRFFKTEMSILETVCMQSTASSAGYSSGSTLVSAIPAYLLLTGKHIPWEILMPWTFFIAALGVFLAIPMKRQMINVEQLKFPSGIAAAETLKSLYSKGKEAKLKARALIAGGLGGSVLAWLREAGRPFAIPKSLSFPGSLAGVELSKFTIAFDLSAIMVAAGALMGWKIAWSLLLGATINYGILAPLMVEKGVIPIGDISYRSIVSWSTWTGASIMVTSGLLMFFLQGAVIKRSVQSLATKILASARGAKSKFAKGERESGITSIEVPTTWFIMGASLSGLGCILLLIFAFHTSWWMGIVAVIISFFLALVACRATGESNITPVGAMGKITQLAFGALAPANIITNLMTASVTAGAAVASADLLTDLKTGYLIGVNPRRQFMAQFLGIFIGVLVAIPAFYILVPTSNDLGTDKWPAPSAQVWVAVAKLLTQGVEALHPTAQAGIVIGGLIGIIFALLEKYSPEKLKVFIPSPMGLGLAMVIPFFNSLSMFLGAFLVLILEKKSPHHAKRFVIPVSSGIIAGESILGIVAALLKAAGII